MGKGPFNIIRYGINTRYVKPKCSQCFTVLAPATTHIEYAAGMGRLELTDQFMNKCPGFFFIPFSIEFMVKGRTEPFFVPGLSGDLIHLTNVSMLSERD